MSEQAQTGQTQTDTGSTEQTGASESTEAQQGQTLLDGAADQQTDKPEGQSDADSKQATVETGEDKGEKKPEDDAGQKGAPEEYAEFTMPEGVEVDADLLGDLKTEAKAMGLTQEQAQKIADLGAKQVQKFVEAQTATMTQARQQWETAAKADKEFGGEKFEENLAIAKKAVDAYATPELRTMLNESGLGNHPELLRVFYRAGKNMSEDRFVGGKTGSAQAGSSRNQADRLYNKS